MLTSTPVNSPMNRRKLSMRQNQVSIDEDEVDNAQDDERQRRRLEAINKSIDQKKRRSVAPPLLPGFAVQNAAQLAQYCKDCIKLSSENKINIKNAFNFTLIDFMATLSKNADSELNKNFQVAGHTLDASVKIYGFRVDAVYAELMKLASGLHAQAHRAADDEVSADSDGEGAGDKKSRPKKRRKKRTIVAAETLNSKTEEEAILDMPPRKTLLPEVDSSNNGAILKRVPKTSDNCVFRVESGVPVWPYEPNKVVSYEPGETFPADELMDLFAAIPVTEDDKLCKEINQDFTFGGEVPENDSDDELMNASGFEFDINASIPEACEPETGAQPVAARLAIPQGGYASDDDIELPPLQQPVIPVTIGAMMRKLSDKNSEYRVLDIKESEWAGPTYWKVRKRVRDSDAGNKENSEAVIPQRTKRTRKGQIKEAPALLSMPDDEVDKLLAPCSSALLSKVTLNKWKPENVTLAKDYQYSADDLFTLYHLPFKVTEQKNELSGVEEAMEEHNDDDDDHGEELNYCSSQIMADDSAEEVDGQANRSGHPADGLDLHAWDEQHMVAAPSVKTENLKLDINYKRKHINVNVLKKFIWESITAEPGLSFTKLLTVLCHRMPRIVAVNLSVPLIFNALLHLCNEKNLKILQPDPEADFTITINERRKDAEIEA